MSHCECTACEKRLLVRCNRAVGNVCIKRVNGKLRDYCLHEQHSASWC